MNYFMVRASMIGALYYTTTALVANGKDRLYYPQTLISKSSKNIY